MAESAVRKYSVGNRTCPRYFQQMHYPGKKYGASDKIKNRERRRNCREV